MQGLMVGEDEQEARRDPSESKKQETKTTHALVTSEDGREAVAFSHRVLMHPSMIAQSATNERRRSTTLNAVSSSTYDVMTGLGARSQHLPAGGSSFIVGTILFVNNLT